MNSAGSSKNDWNDLNLLSIFRVFQNPPPIFRVPTPLMWGFLPTSREKRHICTNIQYPPPHPPPPPTHTHTRPSPSNVQIRDKRKQQQQQQQQTLLLEFAVQHKIICYFHGSKSNIVCGKGRVLSCLLTTGTLFHIRGVSRLERSTTKSHLSRLSTNLFKYIFVDH